MPSLSAATFASKAPPEQLRSDAPGATNVPPQQDFGRRVELTLPYLPIRNGFSSAELITSPPSLLL